MAGKRAFRRFVRSSLPAGAVFGGGRVVKHPIGHITRFAVLAKSPAPLARLGALPAGRGVVRAERIHLVKTLGAVARHAEAAAAARRLLHLHMRLRQLIEK